MALDPLYIASTELMSYFNDKNTGLPLAGGKVYFWEDNARTVPKLVYELVGVPGTYSYVPLPDPIQLSSTGTWMDEAGNNIQIYYYPWDAAGNLQLYFIQVFDAFGTEQFTREAWPNEAVFQNSLATEDIGPISSWLVGWDFPQNPAQFLGSNGVGPFATGANTSSYFWDQTIIFQSANSGTRADRYLDGSLVVTAQQDTRLALIQYMDAPTAADILDDYIACNINISTNQVAGIPCTISLWYTTGTLPSMAAHNSIVATLNADGSVGTTNAGSQPWVLVPRINLGPASFTIPFGGVRENFGFAEWFAGTAAGPDLATFFAIVVGFGTLANTQTLTIGSISAVPGQTPTIPAPQSTSVVLLECCRYYTKSFSLPTVPAQSAGNADAVWFPSTVTGAAGGICQQVNLPTTMAKTTPVYTFYNPQAANAFVWNYSTMASFTATALQQAGNRSFAINFTSDAGCAVGNVLGFHFTADARLGF